MNGRRRVFGSALCEQSFLSNLEVSAAGRSTMRMNRSTSKSRSASSSLVCGTFSVSTSLLPHLLDLGLPAGLKGLLPRLPAPFNTTSGQDCH